MPHISGPGLTSTCTRIACVLLFLRKPWQFKHDIQIHQVSDKSIIFQTAQQTSVDHGPTYLLSHCTLILFCDNTARTH